MYSLEPSEGCGVVLQSIWFSSTSVLIASNSLYRRFCHKRQMQREYPTTPTLNCPVHERRAISFECSHRNHGLGLCFSGGLCCLGYKQDVNLLSSEIRLLLLLILSCVTRCCFYCSDSHVTSITSIVICFPSPRIVLPTAQTPPATRMRVLQIVLYPML